ncbi:MAG: hypothetical protein M1812_005468 [Candelaria pacifica]|nr:MAG: hypothetical protein M1812_005468 [Candelaria pacifica]
MKDGANEDSDIASNDDLLETAWWIMERCVSDRGVGGYDFLGERKLIKIAVYSANSKWDKQLKPSDLRSMNALGGSGPTVSGSLSYPDGNQRGSTSDTGSGSSSAQAATGSTSKPKKPKTRPSTECEAIACGEDSDCCENYSCLSALNARSSTMELAWGVKQFFQSTVLSWCIMSIEQSSSG